MPLYPYRCTKCSHKFEKIQNFSAAPETECPKCGGVLERLLTAPGFNFKGAGWYVNDYSRSGASATESSSSEAKASGEGKSPTGESKAAPSESKSSSSESSGGSASSSPAPAT